MIVACVFCGGVWWPVAVCGFFVVCVVSVALVYGVQGVVVCMMSGMLCV